MSKFTVRDLTLLDEPKNAHLSPLEVIVHVDLDGFYAQCEQVRLNLTASDPVACRQWNSLIAVNYAAKHAGVTRHCSVDDALKLCPNIVLAHVATFKKGETEWAYHDNPNADEYKVCLDPFRRESRNIFSIIKETCGLMEKASIDEAFVDLGAVIKSKALALFPELQDCVSAATTTGNDTVKLPEVPSNLRLQECSVKWHGVLVGRHKKDSTDNYPPDHGDKDDDTPKDWDDVFIMIGSSIAQDIRDNIFSRLKYTCSAGVSRNKILAKLASGSNKPNKQTVVRSGSINEFLQSHELRDLWGFGGKLGDIVVKHLDVPEEHSMAYLFSLSQDEMQRKLADASLATKVHQIVRGEFATPVSTRINIKSMNSVKNFTKPVRTIADCKSWLKVLAADIAHRILELEDELETTVRPKTLSVHYNTPGGKASKSKQSPYASPRQYNFEQLFTSLFQASEGILNVLQREAVLLPCSMLSLSVTGLVIASNEPKTIDGFFAKYKEMAKVRDAKNAQKNAPERSSDYKDSLESSRGSFSSRVSVSEQRTGKINADSEKEKEDAQDSLFVSGDEDDDGIKDESHDGDFGGDDSVTVKCPECRQRINLDNYGEHADWHYAKRLQEEMHSSRPVSANASSTPSSNPLKREAQSSTRSKPTKRPNTQNIMNFFSKKQ